MLALAETLRAEAAVLDELVDAALGGRDEIELDAARALPPALAALVLQRLADGAAGRPAPGTARRAAEILAMGARRRARSAARRPGPDPPRDASSSYTSDRVSDDPAIGEVLVSAEDLQRRVRSLAAEISADYAGRDLDPDRRAEGRGLLPRDLMRALTIPCEVDFMAVASYGSATKSSGVVRILKDLDAVIEGRDVLIVEDIVDSGLTLQYLLRNLAGRSRARWRCARC